MSYLIRLDTAIIYSELKPILGANILKGMKGEVLPPIIELFSGDGLFNVRLSKDHQFKYYLYGETIFFNACPLQVGKLNNFRFTKLESKAFLW